MTDKLSDKTSDKASDKAAKSGRESKNAKTDKLEKAVIGELPDADDAEDIEDIEDIDSLSDDELRHARIDRLCRLADRVVTRLSIAAVELDSTDTQRFRHIVSSIKEIRDIQNLRSDAELREGQLKLAALERQSREEADGVDEITVIIEGDDDFCG